MTEEDQKLVALAALHGARFVRSKSGYWFAVSGPYTTPAKCTISRAAEWYLFDQGLRTGLEHREYSKRTEGEGFDPKDIDPSFIASALA